MTHRRDPFLVTYGREKNGSLMSRSSREVGLRRTAHLLLTVAAPNLAGREARKKLSPK